MIRVLVIDDDAAIRLVLQRSLEHAGFEVSTAEDGARGILAARDLMPDIVILDLLMPHIDGFTVLRSLTTEPSTQSIPVIVLTAVTQATVRDRCMDAGAARVMTKPFDPSALASEITRVLETSRTGSPSA